MRFPTNPSAMVSTVRSLSFSIFRLVFLHKFSVIILGAYGWDEDGDNGSYPFQDF